MEDVDMVHAEPRQAGVQRCGGGGGDVAALGLGEADLGADIGGRFQLCPDAAEIGLGRAVAVLHRGVEVIDAGDQRARDGMLLIIRRAAHHQAADRAAAEAEHRGPQAGAAEIAHFHRGILSY